MDQKLYSGNDMVRVGCNDCKGCSDCCQGMGESIVLDPYDIWQMEFHLQCTFGDLLQGKADLHVENGLILPHLKMQGDTERCVFLNASGRCAIHAFRPGLCRLFPLGRNYEEHRLQYFLLEEACRAQERTKVKVKKWLEIPASGKYENFLISWHDLRKELQEKMMEPEQNPERIRKTNLQFLHIFYETPYTSQDFYAQYEAREDLWKRAVKGDSKTDEITD